MMQSRLIDIDGKLYIVMASEDEITSYNITTRGPWVECASSFEVEEVYELRYHSPCPPDVTQSPVCMFP